MAEENFKSPKEVWKLLWYQKVGLGVTLPPPPGSVCNSVLCRISFHLSLLSMA